MFPMAAARSTAVWARMAARKIRAAPVVPVSGGMPLRQVRPIEDFGVFPRMAKPIRRPVDPR